MPHHWPAQDITLDHFAPGEFDHPGRMDRQWLRILDEWRRRCGFPFKVNDDARTGEEHRTLYAAEIQRGETPPDSAHLRGRSCDVRPFGRHDTPMNRWKMVAVAREMHDEGVWPHPGLIVETYHIHADCDRHLANAGKRPYFGIGVSR